jgi:hypothetical protein
MGIEKTTEMDVNIAVHYVTQFLHIFDCLSNTKETKTKNDEKVKKQNTL